MNRNKKQTKAFTLVELAIVLVIIGLITGGVLGAQSLIDSSTRSSFIQNLRKYETAVGAFKLEYDALPGDFSEAEDYWGAGNTDNGNGDKVIGSFTESKNAWNHLGLSEIYPSSWPVSSGTFVVGTDYPENPYGSGFLMQNLGANYSTSGAWIDLRLGRSLVTFNTVSGGGSIEDFLAGDDGASYVSNIKRADGKKIDKKMDDGLPLSGFLLGPNCSLDDDYGDGNIALDENYGEALLSDFNSSYDLTGKIRNCILFYKNGII